MDPLVQAVQLDPVFQADPSDLVDQFHPVLLGHQAFLKCLEVPLFPVLLEDLFRPLEE